MIKKEKVRESVIAKEEKTKLADELVIAQAEKAKRADELIIANKEKTKLADELVIANEEKAKRASELIIANKEKAKREGELVIANMEKAKREDELVIAKGEKAKRAAELIIANSEKAKRAAEFVIANSEKAKRAAELIIANLKKEKRADELIIANKELIYQKEEKVKRAAELVIADIIKTKREAELVIIKIEKAKHRAKSIIADKELSFQTEEKLKRSAELVVAEVEKEKRVAEIFIANIKKAKRSAALVIANLEKSKRSAELVIANKELVYQKSEKSKCEAELIIAIVEKAKHKAEIVIANIDKAKRAAELVVTNKELVLATEKAKLTAELIIINKELTHQIEKRIQSDQALKESNQKYSEAFLSSPYSITITSVAEGKFIEVNNAFTSIFGFTRKEAITNSAVRFNIWVNIEDRKWVISALLSGKDISGKEFLFRKKNGEIMTGLFTSRIINIKKESFILSSIDDITKRKKFETSLIASEQKSKSIMENSADAIFLANQQGKYIYTNKEVSAMLGYTSEEMINMTISDITDPNKNEEILKIFNQVINEGKSFTEIELLKKDGNYISADLNAVKLPDGNIYGSCRDITERKQAELELIKAKEKAEESDRLKSAFLTNMSHEIRTPMNSILGFADLLKRPNLTSEQQQEFIRIIGESGERMLDTINSLVDISNIEAGLMSVYLSESNINKQIESLYEFFTPLAENRGLQLSFNNGLPSNEAIVKTDKGKFSSILTNLIKNAIKFTDEGSIEIGYKKRVGFLEFFVSDTGIGIPKDRQGAIFERFIQADITDRRAFQGSGLGLSISQKYVEMIGGKIWVESELGKCDR